MRVIKRIGVLSLAKLMGVTMGGFALVIGVFYGIFIVLFSVIGAAGLLGAGEEQGLLAGGAGLGLGLLFAVGMVIGLPIIYGFFGFVFGLLYGWIINLALRFCGGLEFEVQDG